MIVPVNPNDEREAYRAYKVYENEYVYQMDSIDIPGDLCLEQGLHPYGCANTIPPVASLDEWLTFRRGHSDRIFPTTHLYNPFPWRWCYPSSYDNIYTIAEAPLPAPKPLHTWVKIGDVSVVDFRECEFFACKWSHYHAEGNITSFDVALDFDFYSPQGFNQANGYKLRWYECSYYQQFLSKYSSILPLLVPLALLLWTMLWSAPIRFQKKP